MLCFADLKKYKFTYLFAFPALHSDLSWEFRANSEPQENSGTNSARSSIIHLDAQETAALVESVQTWRYSTDSRQHGFFLARKGNIENSQQQSGDSNSSDSRSTVHTSTTSGEPPDKMIHHWSVGKLIEYEAGFFAGVPFDDQYICFADPSTYPEHPAWMLRNLLVLIRKRWKLDRLQILCYRDVQARRDAAKSIVLPLQLGHADNHTSFDHGSLPRLIDMPRVTGWERNKEGKVTSRVANLGEYMDPQRYVYAPSAGISNLYYSLADQAVDLNLKLIKWRIAPTIDLEQIKNTKCLLLGAGTLGSYVSRNLMVSPKSQNSTKLN